MQEPQVGLASSSECFHPQSSASSEDLRELKAFSSTGGMSDKGTGRRGGLQVWTSLRSLITPAPGPNGHQLAHRHWEDK